MGCGNSKSTIVQPVGERNGCEEGNKGMGSSSGKLDSLRGHSAVSKHTTDSGLGLDSEGTNLPGTVPRKLPPLRAAESPGLSLEPKERQKSSDILQELLSMGIIQSQPRVVRNGEAYDVRVDCSDNQVRGPPPRLESLKAKREQTIVCKEDIDKKMKAVEERRKTREEELKSRLCTKSARCRSVLRHQEDLDQGTCEEAHDSEAVVLNQRTSVEQPAHSRRNVTGNNSEQMNGFVEHETKATFNSLSTKPTDDKDELF
nr:PREDICTED: stathmin domain-containing protein 1 isoform X1 [Lepisosteus oculatus]